MALWGIKKTLAENCQGKRGDPNGVFGSKSAHRRENGHSAGLKRYFGRPAMRLLVQVAEGNLTTSKAVNESLYKGRFWYFNLPSFRRLIDIRVMPKTGSIWFRNILLFRKKCTSLITTAHARIQCNRPATNTARYSLFSTPSPGNSVRYTV